MLSFDIDHCLLATIINAVIAMCYSTKLYYSCIFSQFVPLNRCGIYMSKIDTDKMDKFLITMYAVEYIKS